MTAYIVFIRDSVTDAQALERYRTQATVARDTVAGRILHFAVEYSDHRTTGYRAPQAPGALTR